MLSWGGGRGEGLGAGACPRVKLCCSCRGDGCPGENWHHLQERILQGGEYLAEARLCMLCAAWPAASQVWRRGSSPTYCQMWGRVPGG